MDIRALRIITIVLASLLPGISAGAADQSSRSKEAAAKIWAMEPELFNFSTVIPDSLLKKFSAVIIANMVDIDGDIVEANSLYGRNGTTNLNNCAELERTMVKILDEKARDYYSSFEFGTQMSLIQDVRLTEASSDFGARVIKPDGTIVEVDLADALNVGHGKKGDKDKSKKIAIPGLEIGDVLDFYYILKISREESDLPILTSRMGKRYPVMNYLLTGSFNNRLTVEVKSRNGAPEPQTSFNPVTEKNLMRVEVGNLPAVESGKYSNPKRTTPAIDISILNNVSNNLRHIPTARRPGIHTDVPFGAVSKDLAFLAANVPFPEQVIAQAQSMVKSYMKAHPGLSKRQILDVAWIALCYRISIDKNLQANDIVVACLFMDMIEKMKLADEKEVGIAFFNSRFDKPFNDVSRYSELDYGTIAGDTVYTAQTLIVNSPGEWPGRYQGEQGAAYKGKRKFIDKLLIPTVFKLPEPKATANLLNVVSTAEINPEDDMVDIKSTVTASGSRKSSFSIFSNEDEWLENVEDFFQIPNDKRHVVDQGVSEKRSKELQDIVKETTSWFIGTKPKKLNNFEIVSRGLMPGSGGFELVTDGSYEDLVTKAGPNLLLSIGKMFYSTSKIIGEDRQRNSIVWLSAPESTRCKLTLNIPEGFTVKGDAMTQLSNNVKTKVGQFYSSAALSEDGRALIVDYMKRVNFSTLQAKDWEDFLRIEDAAAAFNEIVIPLTPKN